MVHRNRIQEILTKLGLINPAHIEPYYPRVRDREDVGVLIEKESGIIFLDRTDHMDATHYETLNAGSYWGAPTRAEALFKYREDDERRAQQFRVQLEGRDVADIGCGTGGFLDLVRPFTKSVAGVELQEDIRKELKALGYRMYRTAADVEEDSRDIITLFHTVEHLTEPIDTLRDVYRALRPGGIVVVEVPHAKDALLALEAFRAFTLWSEHLMLHTRKSLNVFLATAGFSDIVIHSFQRYPLANHVGWLATGESGGHHTFPKLKNDEVERAYEELLSANDRADTLIARARK